MPATSAASAHFARLIVFGDSNVDDGNLFRLTQQRYPAPPRWHGRESDGPVVVEYLAEGLHAKLEDFAVSGALSGESNLAARFAPQLTSIASTGLLHQIDQFESAGEKIGATDLVLLWAGSNDLFGADRSDRADLDRRIALVRSNLEAALARLQSLGGSHFVVATRSPREVLGSPNDLNGVDLNASISDMVRHMLAHGATDIRLYDAYAAISDMVKNPANYGFTEVTAQCVLVAACAAENFDTGLSIADGYINWDGAHKTTHVHKLMAAQIETLVTR